MYTRIVLTLILIAMIVVAAGLWRPAHRQRPVEPAEPSAGELMLRQRIPGLDLRGVTRDAAAKRLQENTPAHLIIDWPALCGYGDEKLEDYKAGKLDGYLGNVSLATAAKVIFGRAVACQVDGSIVTITRNTALPTADMTVHVYDVSDLVSDEWWGVKSPAAQAAAVQTARMEKVRGVVALHTDIGWHIEYAMSGTPGGNAYISACGSCLIISQTTDGQMEVANILAELRRTRQHP